MSAGKIEWQTILTMVAMVGAFISFCVNFDRRVSGVEGGLREVGRVMDERDGSSREYRAESKAQMKDISDKLDRMIERGGK